MITGRRCNRCHPHGGSYSGTRRGTNLRELKLANDPMCQWNSAEPGVGRSSECRYPATEVDHIQTVKERPDLRYVYTNLQSLCHDHHAEKTRQDNERLRSRVY